MSVWVGATLLLGRDVPTDQPYPHICHLPLPHTRGTVWSRDCAACATTPKNKKAPKEKA